jgi:hypothetical protein
MSEVTEKWRYRMLVPDKGDYVQVPLNPAGRNVANAWDPARDQASGEACKSYGAAALLQVRATASIVGRQHAPSGYGSGTQTRLLHSGASPPDKNATWQSARWRYGAERTGTGVTARRASAGFDGSWSHCPEGSGLSQMVTAGRQDTQKNGSVRGNAPWKNTSFFRTVLATPGGDGGSNRSAPQTAHRHAHFRKFGRSGGISRAAPTNHADGEDGQ